MIIQHKSQSLTEYVLIISIVLAALVGMEVYVKRSVQGRVKDLTDLLIAGEDEHTDQVNEVIPLLDEASGKITSTKVNLRETVSETPQGITRKKNAPQGESFYRYSESKYQSFDPDEKIVTSDSVDEGSHVVSGAKIGQIYSRYPDGS